MEKINAEELLIKYAQGKCTPGEQLLVEAGIVKDLNGGYQEISNEEIETANLRIKNRIEKDVLAYPISKHFWVWPRIAVAAAVTMIVAGIWFFVNELNFNQKSIYHSDTVIEDVGPGKQGATLTLTDGKKIRLSNVTNGEIANEAGIIITKAEDGQLIYELKNTDNDPDKLNTLTTAKGETFLLTLPDKSKVWLNANSSLTYPIGLSRVPLGKTRLVKLEGEAYFEVTKNKAHPFVVQTVHQEVEVLGTHFSVSSYPDETAVQTTLLEGSVKVSVKSNLSSYQDEGQVVNSQILKPNEQSILINNKLRIRKVNALDAIAWKNGLFVFQDESLESIMRKVARWYDVEVVYMPEVDKNELYYGSVSRYDNISKLIEALELTKDIHFKIEGRRVTVMK